MSPPGCVTLTAIDSPLISKFMSCLCHGNNKVRNISIGKTNKYMIPRGLLQEIFKCPIETYVV